MSLAVPFAVALYFVGLFLLWVGATGVTPPGLTVAGTWRVVFGVFGGLIVVAAAMWGKEVWEIISGGRHIVRPSERGDLRISQRAIRDLVVVLLQRELGLKRPQVEIADDSENLKIHIGLHLPPGEDLPKTTDRVRALVISAVERRIGIPVSAVDISVHGIAKREAPPAPQEAEGNATEP